MQVEARFVPELSWTEGGLPQKVRTKHVHGIHPYLGKYVPQIVDYFIERYFKKDDCILDPFVGSGTTLVEANTHSMDSIGVDISEFNIILCKVKTERYDLTLLKKEFDDIISKVKIRVQRNSIEENLDLYLKANPIAEAHTDVDLSEASEYLRNWYHPVALYPILVFRSLIKNYHYQDALKVLLSRTARSSRLVPHYELDFPRKPFTEDYWCHKHARTCHPTTNALGFLERYSIDTYLRIAEFDKIRTKNKVKLIHDDSQEVDYPQSDGVITSPPYVGLIDYHEQHRYAYELLGLEDKSEKEIGAKRNKSGKRAVENYKRSISRVISKIINNSTQGSLIFVVNDKFDLYESICEQAGVRIKERLRRKVDRRTGRRSHGDFHEDIIVMKP